MHSYGSATHLPPPTKLVTNVTMVLQHPPRALLFDVFGTCVDWRTSVTNALEGQARVALNAATASLASSVRMRASSMETPDWGRFAQQWRDSYKRFTKSLADNSSLPWKTVDEHHLDSLRELLVEWQLEGLWDEDEIRSLSLAWHRLEPWLDSPIGIRELNKLFYTVTLSNGNLALLTDLSAHANLPFTHLFSAELFGSYKPSSTVYLGAVQKLGVPAKDCVMVAAHLADLKAAKSFGYQVAYIERPLEEDWSQEKINEARSWVDVWVSRNEEGLITLARLLGIDVNTEMRRTQSTPV